MVRVINPLDDILPPVFYGFPKEGLVFFQELERNNTRDWFTAHKDEYTASIKEPMEMLLSALPLRMKEALPDIDVDIDPKKSLYRIYRDIRFSKDKTPYKTHAGASFTAPGRDRKYDPGYYFHISASEVVIAGGAYRPPSEQLKHIRRAIDTGHPGLQKIISEKAFVEHFGKLQGDALTRIPRDYEKGHPAEELLKMKNLYCWAQLEPTIATSEDFLDVLVEYFVAMTPLNQWLLKALE